MVRTDGEVFVSYNRERQQDVARLVTWLHLLGVPTWRDVDELGHAEVGSELRWILRSEEISGAILYVTPEVRESAAIRTVEVPESVERFRTDRGAPVAAPIRLGHSSSFGLGLFRPAQEPHQP